MRNLSLQSYSPARRPLLIYGVAVLVRIMELIHEALTDNVITTKRYRGSPDSFS